MVTIVIRELLSVTAYYGCVEAQGQGTLHCHMMIWLEGGLDLKELQLHLKGSHGNEFARRLINFLDNTISNFISEPDILELTDDEENVLPESTVDETTGELRLRILDGMGEDTKAVIYYITDDITKSSLKAHVAYAALEMAMKRLTTEDNVARNDEHDHAQRLLQCSVFSILSNQELSAQQVASYLTDNHFTSHNFMNLYWPSVEHIVNRMHPLRPTSHENTLNATENDRENWLNDEEVAVDECLEDEEVHITTTSDGDLVQLGSQVMDYRYRGNKLDDMSLWTFVVSTCKISMVESTAEDSTKPNTLNGLDEESVPDNRRRKELQFRAPHPKRECKMIVVIEEENRMNIPVPLGPALPRRDRGNDEESYNDRMKRGKERARVEECVVAARRYGLFHRDQLIPLADISVTDEGVCEVSGEELELETYWKLEYDTCKKEWKCYMTRQDSEDIGSSFDVSCMPDEYVPCMMDIESTVATSSAVEGPCAVNPIHEPSDVPVDLLENVSEW
ncbi:hypothetical protein GY45DRAFT_1339379 [Cubamyces sp. BRFM 1775]|nr:hypothetical protein GY45DRAFT_1339379 [Cubamyces sp. BRFM 1775]